MKSVAALLLVLLPGLAVHAAASDGPEIPCQTCESNDPLPKPESGWWYNPHEPGTGFNIEVQGEVLFGSYYGYDGNGAAVWYIFSGPMVEAEGGSGIVVNASLQRYAGGPCLQCEYSEAEPEGDAIPIELRFQQRNHARIAIAGRELSVVPLIAGALVRQDFPSVDYAFPELAGTWVFVLTDPELAPFGTRSLVLNSAQTGRRFRDDGTLLWVRHHFYDLTSQLEVVLTATVECAIGDTPDAAPACTLAIAGYFPSGEFRSEQFPLSIANIGDSRIVGRTDGGVLVEARRLDYD